MLTVEWPYCSFAILCLCLTMQGPVVRKVDSVAHRTVIFPTATEMHKNDIRNIKLARGSDERTVVKTREVKTLNLNMGFASH